MYTEKKLQYCMHLKQLLVVTWIINPGRYQFELNSLITPTARNRDNKTGKGFLSFRLPHGKSSACCIYLKNE